MKTVALATVISSLLSALTLAAFEVVYSLYEGRKPHRSNESAYGPYFAKAVETHLKSSDELTSRIGAIRQRLIDQKIGNISLDWR